MPPSLHLPCLCGSGAKLGKCCYLEEVKRKRRILASGPADRCMIVDCRDPNDYAGYEYYNLRGRLVRTILDDDGDFVSADEYVPGSGELCRNVTLMSQVERDPICDEVSEEEFYALCEEWAREWARR